MTISSVNYHCCCYESCYKTSGLRNRRYTRSVYGCGAFEYGVQEERGPESQDATRTDISTAQQAVPRMPPEGSYLRRHDHVWVHMHSVQRISVSFAWLLNTVRFLCGKEPALSDWRPFVLHSRGINPPHRVKSVSMTTFSEAELDKLRNGGNEVGAFDWLCSGWATATGWPPC